MYPEIDPNKCVECGVCKRVCKYKTSDFANTLVVYTGANFGGLAFNNVIAVGEAIDLFFMVDEDELKEGLHFGIQYIDSMRNEYIQEYDMKKEYSSIKIECGYPGFLEQF